MAVVNVLIQRTPQVWAVLADGFSDADWVVGTKHIRAVDEELPELGSSNHYTVGAGPLTFEGKIHRAARRARPAPGLEADSPPLGTARIAIDVLPWGEDALVLIDEPVQGNGLKNCHAGAEGEKAQ